MVAPSTPAPARVTVTLDPAAPGQRRPLRRIWRYVGYDEPNYTYTANGRALLGKLAALVDAPYYARCHFLLCSGDGTPKLKWGSTNVYTEDPDGNPVYSWTVLDRILDAYVELGCVPFIELCFTPEALTTAPVGTSYDDPRHGGWRYPPKDYGRWLELVRHLAQHCLERYGLAEVSRWYWELWNEPDIFCDVGGIATVDCQGAIQIFLYSHHDDWDVMTPSEVTVQVHGTSPELAYTVTRTLIAAGAANAYTAWDEMGRPQPPSADQLAQLHQASRLQPVDMAPAQTTPAGLAFTVTLPSHSVCLLEVTPALR